MQSDPDQIAEMVMTQDLARRGVLWGLFQQSSVSYCVFDAETLEQVSANAAARGLMSDRSRQLHRPLPWQLVNGLSRQRVSRLLQRIRVRHSAQASFLVAGEKGDAAFAVVVRYFPSDTPSFVVALRDVSRFQAYKTDAARAVDTLTTAIEALPDGFALYDAEDRLVLCNQTYKTFYSNSAPAMVPGARFEDILRYGLDRGEYIDAIGREDDWLAERLANHHAADNDVEQLLADGRWLRVLEKETRDGGRVGLRIDITALKTKQLELRQMLLTDELTGLRNRRDLSGDVDMLAASLDPGARLAVMHIDLDRFRGINDVFGHDAGDAVLRTVARRMQDDWINPALVARIGGDEFAVLLTGTHTDAALLQAGQDLIGLLEQPIPYHDNEFEISAAIGLAIHDAAATNPGAATLSAAGIAQNLAKRDGRGTIRLFEAGMRERTRRNSDIAAAMKAGLARDEFAPFFQPQINARTGAIKGFEALIRWNKRDGAPVAAGEFLALAQDAGMTEDLDNIVMAQSCAAVRQMMDWGLKDPCISLNMSMAQIKDANLIGRLTNYINAAGISPRNLRIELLESTLLDDRAATIIANVHRMIDAGFLVELDDFGTGHAAIATLRKFSVSQIKIDRSLIRDIDRDASLQTITGAIIDLAQNLGIGVLAEGVETDQEQKKLMEFNCDIAQGYLHARPMPLHEIRDFLRQRGDISD